MWSHSVGHVQANWNERKWHDQQHTYTLASWKSTYSCSAFFTKSDRSNLWRLGLRWGNRQDSTTFSRRKDPTLSLIKDENAKVLTKWKVIVYSYDLWFWYRFTTIIWLPPNKHPKNYQFWTSSFSLTWGCSSVAAFTSAGFVFGKLPRKE